MKEKELLITFDYELYLGKDSGSVKNCLISPTNKIIEILTKYDVKAIFFVDTTYIYKLTQLSSIYNSVLEDLNQIKNQLRDLANQGHMLFHHFHPHWLDAEYNTSSNTWDCSNHSRFALSNLEKSEIEEIVSFSNHFLRSLYSESCEPEYLGFRAGGLYSQPFNQLISIFKKHNIKYDFSVLKGAFSYGDTYSFDYTMLDPKLSLIYSFQDSNTEEKQNGFFTEFALNNFQMNFFQKVINSLFYRIFSNNRSWSRMGD
jgi:hypothetical protein